jgi:hypothetical protein
VTEMPSFSQILSAQSSAANNRPICGTQAAE